MKTQIFFPLGTDENFVTSNDELQKCIKNESLISAKIIEYDIGRNCFILNLFGSTRGIIDNNNLFDKQNTASSFVGKVVKVKVTESLLDNMYICIFEPRYDEAKKALVSYEHGTKLQGKVHAILGYGVMVDTGLGVSTLLHLSEIQKVYPEVVNPSQIYHLNQKIEVFIDKSDGTTKYSLVNKTFEEENNKFVNLLKVFSGLYADKRETIR